MKSIVKDV